MKLSANFSRLDVRSPAHSDTNRPESQVSTSALTVAPDSVTPLPTSVRSGAAGGANLIDQLDDRILLEDDPGN